MNRLLPLLALLLLPTVGAAAQTDIRIVQQVQGELRSELQPLDRIMPGYKPAEAELPRFAVGDFRIRDESLRPWSRAIAEILRWKIQYVPDVRLVMPSFYLTAIDAGNDPDFDAPLVTERRNFEFLHQTLGIQTVLTGELSRTDNGFVFDVELLDAVDGTTRAERRWVAPTEDLSAPLISISAWVYEELGLDLSPEERAYLEDPEFFRSDAIAAFAEHYEQIYTLERVPKHDLLTELRARFPKFPLFACYALHSLPVAMDVEAGAENYRTAAAIRSQFPLHTGISLESYRAINMASLPEHEIVTYINGLRELAIANSSDPIIMLNFSAALGNDGNTLDALGVMSEAVRRWPDHYRMWWNYAWLLNTHAWQVRGHKYWSEVPEFAQKRFKLMSHLAHQAVDRTLSLHPENSGIWILKLNIMGGISGYSDELMQAFEDAVAIAPHEETIYGNALNYSLDQWGGNATARRRIIRLAEENNPDAVWPEIMRAKHAGDFEELDLIGESIVEKLGIGKLLDDPDFWKLVLTIIGLIIAYSIFGSRKNREKEEDPFAPYRSD